MQSSCQPCNLCKVLTWENKLHTALVVAAINMAFIINRRCGCNMLSILLHIILLSIPISMVLKVMGKIKVPEKKDEIAFPQDCIKQSMECVYTGVNNHLQWLKNIFLMKDRKKSYMFLIHVIAAYISGRYLNDFTIILVHIDLKFAMSYYKTFCPDLLKPVFEIIISWNEKAKNKIVSILKRIPKHKEKDE